jgi:predicted amidohydrolase YtcJ
VYAEALRWSEQLTEGNHMKNARWIITGLMSTLLSLPVFADETKDHTITVFTARKIITMDPGWPEATVVAVRDGKILSVGSSMDDLKPWLNKIPYKVDNTFQNKILTPGFIEPHGHPLLGGIALSRPELTYLPQPNPYGPGFPGVKTKADAMTMLKSYVDKQPAGKPLIAWGYDVVAMGSPLNAAELDKVSASLPIIVWDTSGHMAFTNTAALKKFNVTVSDNKIPGIKFDKNNQPNGQFYGVPAVVFILKKALLGELTPDEAYKCIKFLMDLSHKNGITSTTEMTFGIINFQLEQALYNRYFNNPNTPMRLIAITYAESATHEKQNNAVAFVKSFENQATDKFMFNGVKFFSDDAFVSLNMVIENPGYTDGHQGQYIIPPDQLVAAMTPWWDAGFHIHVHSNGNGGNASTINALYQLMQHKPRFDHRFSVEHYGISTPAMARELKQLGGVVSANPNYFYARAELNEPFLGTDRADTAAAFNTLLKAGVPTSMHSDTPVAPPEPLKEVWMVVNRFGVSGKVHAPAERVSVEQALRMITIDAAYTIGEDTKIGSISPGKFADFTVLEADPFAVPKENIKDIQIWGTVVGGKVYAASDYSD